MKTMHATGWPMRLLDALCADGGWLTRDGLLLAFGDPPAAETANRALWRLENRGLVEYRVVRLARRQGRIQGLSDVRVEWRFKGWPDG